MDGDAVDEKQYRYLIVLFNDGLQVVPKTWLDRSKKICFWPNYKNLKKFNKAVECMETIQPDWSPCQVLRHFGGSDSFERAKEKLRLAEIESDVNTDIEEKQHRRNRAKRDFPEFSSGKISSSSDDDEPTSLQTLAYKLPEFPSPVKRMRQAPPDSPPTSTPLSSKQVPISKSPLKDKKFEKRSIKSILTYLIPIKKQMVRLEDNQKDILKALNDLKENITPSGKTLVAENTVRIEIVNNADIGIDFPISSVEKLTSIEEKLNDDQDGTYRAVLIQHFSKYGGRDVKFCTRDLMRKVVSNEVAALYSWLGWKKKMVFKDLALAGVICDIVRINFPSSTHNDIANVIKIWLSKAKERAEKGKDRTVNGGGDHEDQEVNDNSV